MIYTVGNFRTLTISSPFLQYIQKTYGYTNEYLFYSQKYSTGTFSIQNPSNDFKNCQFISGYPHFDVPDKICMEEICAFIEHHNIYKNQFIIRYGDTHPHKPIPKLGQMRNILIANSLSNMIGDNANLYYGFGDISIKSLQDFVIKNHLQLSAEDFFVRLVNNRLSLQEKAELSKYNAAAINAIKEFLKDAKIEEHPFLIESSLYSNQNLYQAVKENPLYKGNLKSNGEVNYVLQEIMFIKSLVKSNSDTMINIIGSNQSDHIVKVLDLAHASNLQGDIRFLSYGMCENASEVIFNIWSHYLAQFIEQKNLLINGKYLLPIDFLKIITVAFPMDSKIDFFCLEKYVKTLQSFCKTIECLIVTSDKTNEVFCVDHHTMRKMALVHYTLNKSIESGNISSFFNYLIKFMGEKNNQNNRVFKNFIFEGFRRLGFDHLEENYG